MDTVICKEVIISTIRRRGKGTEHSPIRIITEVYEKDGTLIAENDPSPETFSATDLINFGRWLNGTTTISITTVNDWLDSITIKSGNQP